jgi:hypothetical protein
VQPEPVLSAQQIEDIASGKTTIEEIEARIRRQQARLKLHNKEIPDISMPPLVIGGEAKTLKDVLAISAEELQYVKNTPLDMLEEYDIEKAFLTESAAGNTDVNTAAAMTALSGTDGSHANNGEAASTAGGEHTAGNVTAGMATPLSAVSDATGITKTGTETGTAATATAAGTEPVTFRSIDDSIGGSVPGSKLSSARRHYAANPFSAPPPRARSPEDGKPVGRLPPTEETFPPRAIKTRSPMSQPNNSFNPDDIANSPYKSDAEYFRVYNAGVPAGAGLSLYRSPLKKRRGRYVAGSAPPPINPMLPTPYKGPTSPVRPFF